MTSVMLTREAREIYTKREVFPVLEVLFVYLVLLFYYINCLPVIVQHTPPLWELSLVGVKVRNLGSGLGALTLTNGGKREG